MRIIGGSLKGRSIDFLKNSNTRPLKDSVKESIFNVLIHSNLIQTKIEKSKVLDLYSGIGSFGIEAISRGAERITFVDKDINAIDILNNNLIKLSITNKSKVLNSRIENFLNKEINEKFDIFFLDPPFADFNFLDNLKTIKKKKIFSDKYIIIIHREGKTEDELKSFFEIIEIKQYGRSKIIFGVFK